MEFSGTDHRGTVVCPFGRGIIATDFSSKTNILLPIARANLSGMEARLLLEADTCGKIYITSPLLTIMSLSVGVIR